MCVIINLYSGAIYSTYVRHAFVSGDVGVEVLVAHAHAADAVDVGGAALGGAVAARGTPVAHHCQHIVTLATIIISLARSIGTLPPRHIIYYLHNKPCCCGC